jgi:phosphatidylserine/phosphatidylglycerophosphate/cardiolipin synthase-like enzyme
MFIKTWRYLLLMAVLTTVSASDNIFSRFMDHFHQITGSSPAPTTVPAAGTIEVAFSPNNGATASIVKAISEAKKNILVSAYSFTSKEIATALVNAKKRNVKVRLVLDRTQASQKYSSSTFFANQGFDLRIDIKHAIFHDKVMIIDDKTVITGSFNFTKAAQEKNAENVLIIRNNSALAKLYTQDWLFNYSQAVSRDEFASKHHTNTRQAAE